MLVRYRKQFKKDYHLMTKRGLDIGKLDEVIVVLSIPAPLDAMYNNHPLVGTFAGCQECHIEPDWLFVYEYEILEDGEQQLVCLRTGSHADLFR